MKFFYVFLTLVFFISIAAKVDAQIPEEIMPVRGFIWGLPSDVIKENEQGRYVDTEEFDAQNKALFFVDTIRNMHSSIAYEFYNDTLWQARIFIDKTYFDPQDRMVDILTIHTDLNKRFGEPVDEQMIWRDAREKNFPDSWGWAIFRQELTMITTWREGDTMVTAHVGAKEKYKPTMRVTYTHLPTKLKLEQKNVEQDFWHP